MVNDKQISGKLLGPMIRSVFSNNPNRQLFWHRVFILAITFVIYMVYHMSRRPWSIVKSSLVLECSNSSSTNTPDYSCNQAPFNGPNAIKLMGLLDTSFLFTYAFFMFVSGYFAERSNLRYFLTISLMGCGLTCILFGMAHTFNLHVLWYFVSIQILSGIVQTTGWPAVVAVVGNWFGSSKKGTIFGLWNWHTSVGNILGAVVAGTFSDSDWTLSFVVPGVLCIGTGVVVFFVLIPNPNNVGIKVSFTNDEIEEIERQNGNLVYSIEQSSQYPVEAKLGKHRLSSDFTQSDFPVHSTDSMQKEVVEEHPKDEVAISIWQAILIPGVIEFSACLFFAKLVSYTFLYWLPLYLSKTGGFSSSHSAFISVTFDIGGCIGSLLAGFIADQTGASGLTCIVFLILAIPSVRMPWLATKGVILLHSMQFIAGLFINGPYALITTAVSANLACKVPSKSAMATVSALIDGTGSIGAAIGPSLAGIVSAKGWQNVFYMTMAADLLAVVALLRVGFFQELKQLRRKYF